MLELLTLPFHLLGGALKCFFGILGAVFSLIGGFFGLVFGILGGIFSLLKHLLVASLIVGLIGAVLRRGKT